MIQGIVCGVANSPDGVFIASMGGMSEFTMMLDDDSVDWRLGYPIFTLAILVVGLGLWCGIHGWIRRLTDDGDHNDVAAAGLER